MIIITEASVQVARVVIDICVVSRRETVCRVPVDLELGVRIITGMFRLLFRCIDTLSGILFNRGIFSLVVTPLLLLELKTLQCPLGVLGGTKQSTPLIIFSIGIRNRRNTCRL